MNLTVRNSALLAALLASNSDAFTTTPSSPSISRTVSVSRTSFARPVSRHYSSFALNSKAEDDDDEIERLRSMAAKLRAEAAQLEAQQKLEMANAAERAFRKFDTNKDGQISFEELKEGLEKVFKMELPEKRVRALMQDFDKTGDGTSLKIDDFVTVEQFRNRLDALAREEKLQAQEAAKLAKQEEDAVKILQAQLEMINDKPPSNTDKIISILPYLFPLLDGLTYARFLILENPDNPISAILAITYGLYRSIPFGGFIAFFALSFLSGNPSINRLIRFNMQQAIYLDIALFFPGLIGALYGLIANSTGGGLPPAATEIGSDVLFATLMTAIGYCSISSLLGQTPNKLPLISDAVEARMPTIDMFDEKGRFNPRRKDDDDDDKKKKD